MPGAMYGVRLIGQAALDVLMEAVERLAGAADELAVAAVVRTAARRLTGADGVSIVLKKGDRVHYVDEDAIGPLWKGQNFPSSACISGWAIQNKQTVVIADIEGDPRIPLAAYRPTFVKSLVMAPVGLPDPFAAIGAYWGEKRRPTDEEVRALESIARAASVAMENARLRRELSEALTRARAAERARSVFVSHVSRNIRAPLSSIAARAEFLERAEIAPRLQKLAESLKVSAESAAALVAEILEFAQIEGAQDVRFPAPFHLEAAVRVAAAPYVTDASRRGLGFAIDIAPEAVGNFVGDGAHVQRMVDLLVADVVKRTQSGQVNVRLSLEEQAGVRMMFKLSVMSTDPAFVAAQPEEEGATPHGVDLLVAHAIAQAIGSALNVETLPGGGGAFTAHVPLDLPMDEVSERRLAAR